jgi:hypothetical protein
MGVIGSAPTTSTSSRCEQRPSGDTAEVQDQLSRPMPGQAVLVERLEAACRIAADLYHRGEDTSKADAEVDRLLLLLDPEPDG